MIRAKLYTDDLRVEVEFDATPYFDQATDDDISTLLECYWVRDGEEWYGHDYPGDTVARWRLSQVVGLERAFTYIEIGQTGFECLVLADDLEAWLRVHRPLLLVDDYSDATWGNAERASPDAVDCEGEDDEADAS